MPVKAFATVPVSRPVPSFSNQHNAKRNRCSGSGDLVLKTLEMANRTRWGGGRNCLKNPLIQTANAAATMPPIQTTGLS